MPALLVATLVLSLASVADQPASSDVSGRVVLVRAEGATLLSEPLEGAVVVVGRGLGLGVDSGGRDTLAAGGITHHIRTGSDGTFRFPAVETGGPVDVLVWAAGCVPVLRQAIEAGTALEVGVRPSPATELHRTLLLPPSLLIGRDDRTRGEPYVDRERRLLVPIPAGYGIQESGSGLVGLRLSNSVSEIAVLHPPSAITAEEMAELLRAPEVEAPDEGARLMASLTVRVDGLRAVQRDFLGRTRRTRLVYLTRHDASVVLAFSSARADYDAELPAFRECLDGLRFYGPRGGRRDEAGAIESRTVGARVELPEPWRPVAGGGPALAAACSAPPLELLVTRVDGARQGPEAVANRALAEAGVTQDISSSWELVGDAVGWRATGLTAAGEPSGARSVSVYAVRDATGYIIIRLAGAPRVLDHDPGAVRAVLESVRILTPARSP